MIRIAAVVPELDAAERFGLTVWLDLARVIVVQDPSADVVEFRIGEPMAGPTSGDGDDAVGVLRTLTIAIADGVVTVDRSALRAITAVVSAADEQRSVARDRHGRVPPTENALVRQGAEAEPVASEAAVRLRRAVGAAAGRRLTRFVAPWPNGKRWAVALTHDLDVVALWPVFTAIRVAELIRGGGVSDAARALLAGTRSALGRPVEAGVDAVVEADTISGAAATWFILCGTPSWDSMRAGDLTYRPESPAARSIVRSLTAAGHEIGLHGSFATGDDASGAVFTAQRARLQAVAAQPAGVVGVRQHFLRMRPGPTQHAMAASGFAYDATFGFSDRNGFRLGVADVVPGWDVAAQQETGLAEVPLTWMDRALSKYQRVEAPEEWTAAALTLAEACRAVDGLWVGLWHPNLTPPLGYPRVRDTYKTLVRTLVEREPYCGSLRDIVRWRRLRRSVRAERVERDGRVVLASAPGVVPGASGVVIDIEDATGTRVQRLDATC
jgi:hypothetical protein